VVLYEWVPFGQTAPRRKALWKIILAHIKTQWPTAYRNTSAFETPSEHIAKPFNLKNEIAFGVSYKHFETAEERCTITAYIDDKYNDYTEEKYDHGHARKVRTYVNVDMAYRFTEHVSKLDDDDWPVQYEGNKIMIDNILSDCAALQPYGVHYIFKRRTVFDGRYSDEEIFLERLSRDADEKVKDIDNDAMWIYRKIYAVETFEGIKVY
jgi:hypothetical protein